MRKLIILPLAAMLSATNAYGYAASESCNAITNHNCATWENDSTCPTGDPFCRTEAGRYRCYCKECAIVNHVQYEYEFIGETTTPSGLKYTRICVKPGTGGGSSSGGGTTTEYELCSSTNQCRNFSVTIDGQTYCSTGSTCTGGPTSSYTTAFIVSPYCKDYKGVAEKGGRCQVVSCATGYYKLENGYCGYSCGTGWYGSATGLNNAGCTRCPAASNVYTNAGLSSQAYGTTLSYGAKDKSSCFLGAGTYYDGTGMFEVSGTNADNCGA